VQALVEERLLEGGGDGGELGVGDARVLARVREATARRSSSRSSSSDLDPTNSPHLRITHLARS
jgi:hypothetical protein